MTGILIAVTALSLNQGGVELSVDAETLKVNPARSMFLTVTLKAKPSVKADLPDLRDRVVGFSLAEDFEEEPVAENDGRVKRVVNWRLVPEPCAEVYRLKPFAVGDAVCGPLYFVAPEAREPVTGDIEVEVSKDFPPLSWRLVGVCTAALAALAAAAGALWWLVRLLLRKIREHRMSPIERAWVELDRLIRKGLPGRGRYKDFYVELTMVVRRYVQRKYGVKAPHMTTEEFLREVGSGSSGAAGLAANTAELRKFLESADMVKFAGVEATPEMAEEATDGARNYLKSDDTAPVQKEAAR